MTKDADMRRFLEMCLALTAERDRETLLSTILDTAMDLAHCDAGTLYLLESNGLHFCRMVTRSQGGRQGGHDDPITLPPVPLEEKYVCAWAALHNEAINVLLDSLVGSLSTAIDKRSHYNANHTRNMAAMGKNFLDWLEMTDNDWKFDANRRRTFLMSVWLHDMGEPAVPLEVMDKETRLG